MGPYTTHDSYSALLPSGAVYNAAQHVSVLLQSAVNMEILVIRTIKMKYNSVLFYRVMALQPLISEIF